MAKDKGTLEKRVSRLNGLAIAISMVVGAGLFSIPGLAIRATGPVTTLIAWALIIGMMPALIYVFAYLGQRYPAAEGLSLHATLGLGPWARQGVMLMTCGTRAVGMPAAFLVGGSYIAIFLGLAPSTATMPCAISLAILTTVSNLRGVDRLGWINKWIVSRVLLTIMALSVYALPTVRQQYSQLNVSHMQAVSGHGIWSASVLIFWLFQGW